MAVENWIDDVARLWEIRTPAGLVKSYRMFEKTEFPESLSTFPCAITYPVTVKPNYAAGASYDLWTGKTEFHLSGNLSKAAYPWILPMFARIRNAAALSIGLGGKVSYFVVTEITGPVALQYGGEEPHNGLVVSWTVKENEAVTVTV